MLQRHFSRFLRDRNGNFGIITAVAAPVLIAVAGVAIDLTAAMERKGHLQSVADAAALATAAAMAESGEMSEAEAKALGTNYAVGQELLKEQKANSDPAHLAAFKAELEERIEVTATTTTISNTADSYKVHIRMREDFRLNPMTALLGKKMLPISVESFSQSGREGNALSIYLVLDESGSMASNTTTVNPARPEKQVAYTDYSKCVSYNWRGQCTKYGQSWRTEVNYLSKMESLKAAATIMFDELDAADPDKVLVRVGANSYDHEFTGTQVTEWGTDKARTFVDKLPDVPAGGTDAYLAMKDAYDAIKRANSREKTLHDGNGNSSFGRFVVFMTDGEMTGYSANWNSSIHANVRALCTTMKDDGIKVYSIAFMAPSRGRELLNDCSSGDGYYYEPKDMTALVQSFGEIARKAAKSGTRLTQ